MFLVKLNALAIPLYLIIYFNVSYPPLQNFVASAASSLFSFFGENSSQNMQFVSLVDGGKILHSEVTWESTGWKSVYALAALVIATPFVSLRKKFNFLVAALPAIFAINFLRIVTTIQASFTFGLVYFDLIHTQLWRVTIIAAVVGLWLYWFVKEKHNIRENQPIFRI